VEHGDENTVYLMKSGIVGNFVFEQLDKSRVAFKGLSFEQFMVKMDKTDMYFNTFQKYLLRNRLDIDLSENKAIVNRYLAAEFARQLYGESKYFEIIVKEDAMIKAVLKYDSPYRSQK
jgi:carboxyl-terminal processing protease